MTCPTCAAESADDARFCSHCGTQLLEEVRRPGEVTLAWLREIAGRLGYRPDPEASETSSLFLRHPSRYFIRLNFKEGAPLVGVNAAFHLDPVAADDLPTLYESLNAANARSALTTWFVGLDKELLSVYAYVPLLAGVSDADVSRFLKDLEDEIRRLMHSTGLDAFWS
jgi:hypothetical protein